MTNIIKLKLSSRDLLMAICILIVSVFAVYRCTSRIISQEGLSISGTAKKIGKSLINPVKKSVNNSVKSVKRIATEAGNGVTEIGGKVDNTIDNIGKVITQTATKTANQAGEQMTKQIKGLTNKIEGVGNMVTSQITTFTSKLSKMFKQFGVIIYSGIVLPLITFFAGFGEIFVQLFQVIMKIVEKIVMLPLCLPLYMISGAMEMATSIYKWITPSFIQNTISFVKKWIVNPILKILFYIVIYPMEFILNLFGVSILNVFKGSFFNKCFSFNVNEQLKAMGKAFKKMAQNFAKTFGRMDFTKLNVF